MFDPYNGGPDWGQSQMPFGFTGGNPADFSAMPASPPFTPPLNWGGTSRRNCGSPIPAPKDYKQTYELDAASCIWYSAQYVNGLLRKRIPLTSSVTIQLVVDIVDHCGNLLYVAVQYFTDAVYTVVLSAADFRAGRFVQNMNNITRLPGCTKRQANDLIEFLMLNAPKITFTLYPHQGFIEQPDGSVIFAVNPDVQQMPEDIIPGSLRIRSLKTLPGDLTAVNRLWLAVKALHQQIRLLLLFRIGSLLRFYLKKANVSPNTLLILKTTLGVGEEQLYALMSTNNIRLHPIPILDGSEKNMTAELCLVWDGVVVLADRSLADESAKREEALRFLIREAAGDTGHGRNSIVLISPYAAYEANQIAAANVLSVSLDGVTLDADSDTIVQMVSAVDSIIIHLILTATDQAKSAFIEKCKVLPPYWGKHFGSPLSDLAPFLMGAEYFLRDFCDLSLLSDEELKEILSGIYSESITAISADQIILNEFAAFLSEQLRSGKYDVIPKKNHMRVDLNRAAVITAGDWLFISKELLDNGLRAMPSTPRRSSVLHALRQNGALNATDGDTHPIQVYDLNGKSQRLYWYCIDASILEADVLHRLHNIDTEQFWLAPDEVSERDFMPLLRDESGRVAGMLLQYADAENNHMIITGQTGIGKSYLGDNLMAEKHALGHTVIALDNSDSHTYDSMCRNLSQEYVERNVVFIDINTDGIPVNLFSFDRSATLPAQKKQLLDVLTAGIGELSAPQANALRSVISDTLTLLGRDEQLSPADLLAMLNEDSATYASLQNRCEPLFADINALGMASRSWGELLRQNAGKIIVIRTASACTERGDQLIDMMLVTLFRYQRENPSTPLDIFIDEIQNQSFSDGSPIRAIVKEGRKFHCAFIGATQDYYPRSTEIGKVMGKAGIQIFLRPTQDSEGTVASELRFGKADRERFDTMQRGDVIIKGWVYSKSEQRNIPRTLSGQVAPFIKDGTDTDTPQNV